MCNTGLRLTNYCNTWIKLYLLVLWTCIYNSNHGRSAIQPKTWRWCKLLVDHFRVAPSLFFKTRVRVFKVYDCHANKRVHERFCKLASIYNGTFWNSEMGYYNQRVFKRVSGALMRTKRTFISSISSPSSTPLGCTSFSGEWNRQKAINKIVHDHLYKGLDRVKRYELCRREVTALFKSKKRTERNIRKIVSLSWKLSKLE